MLRLNQVKLPVSFAFSIDRVREKAAEILKCRAEQLCDFRCLKRSLDARKKPELFFSYTVRFSLKGLSDEKALKRYRLRDLSMDTTSCFSLPELPERIKGESISDYFRKEEHRPRIVGFGPAGMFAGLVLVRLGMKPIIYERGSAVEKRSREVEVFWKTGKLHPSSNPQFGEGGAGTFSDGKLNTLVRDVSGRNHFVLEEFVKHGADPEILLEAKPHVGTDALVRIVRAIREEILSLGGEIRFETQFHFERLPEYPLILATGHSARDSYRELFRLGLPMRAKDFAMGFRVQHPQSLIDRGLYGEVPQDTLRVLGPSAYKLTHRAKRGRAVYSFCMCPGGYVLNASSEEHRLAINGMSYRKRDSGYANAAVIMGIRKEEYGGTEDPLAGLCLQEALEERAYALGQGKIPTECFGEFEKAVMRQEGISESAERETYRDAMTHARFRGETEHADLSRLFSFDEASPYRSLNDINESFVEGMHAFSRCIPGFSAPETVISGIESRTSSPVRIERDENFRAGMIFPCGEGAGYAGGIMSAAMDGIKVAEALVKYFASLI